MILDVRDCTLSFGGVRALAGFSLSLSQNELLGVIGPNGAGKTTLFNILTGVYRPDRGGVFLLGDNLLGLAPHEISRKGLVRTFQNIRLFQNLSVEDNVLAGFHSRMRSSLLGAAFRARSAVSEEETFREKSRHLLELFGLSAAKEETAKNLPYGDQRKLEIVRALATRPKILLLDEPAAGMNASEKKDLVALIRRVRDEFDLAIILIEHDMSVVMGLCARLIVLDHGVVIAEGTPEEVRKDPKVIEAYLGKTDALID